MLGKKPLLLGLAMLITGCTSLEVDHSAPIRLSTSQTIGFFPFTNLTETPQADERAEAIAMNLLRTKGLRYATAYPPLPAKPSLIPGVKQDVPRARLLEWARQHQINYAIMGNVTEWNYKVGLDGEPAIGINLEMVDVHTGRVVWSAVGSKSGGSRTALSSVAQNLIEKMLDSLTFT